MGLFDLKLEMIIGCYSYPNSLIDNTCEAFSLTSSETFISIPNLSSYGSD
jgi:hypothetical protein